jgi:hypothetical protein
VLRRFNRAKDFALNLGGVIATSMLSRAQVTSTDPQWGRQRRLQCRKFNPG